MRSAELRERFLSFFAARDHTRRPSDSLVPSGDPTVLFTSAGMNQFKDYFLGKRTDLRRAASCQKCLRTGDLERVGTSASHHSFFEMLGNFSFGDYFKREAIHWAWEFLTGTHDYAGTMAVSDRVEHCLSLPSAKLWVSVYEEDEEARTLWQDLGVPPERIRRFGQEENFWPANAPTAGPNGPCGPCSEIYFDADGLVAGPRSVEVWNLVFTQFDRTFDGTLKPLSTPHIDTGMGLERLTSVVQGTETDYETDCFAPIVAALRMLPRGTKVKRDQVTFAERAIADHLRAIVFLLADGVRPSNESRGYVLRMLIRRAHRLGRVTLDLTDGARGFLSGLVESVHQAMAGSPYVEDLARQRETLPRLVQEEESQFIQTLAAGTNRVEELIRQVRSAKQKIIKGDEAFTLYDTYGFPLEITEDIAQEHGLTVAREGFMQALAAQQARSRASSQFGSGIFVMEALQIRSQLSDLAGKDEQFVGYGDLIVEARIEGVWDGAAWVPEAREGQQVGVVLSRSPFYGEAGGQVGDIGTIDAPKGTLAVAQTTWVDDVLVHHARVTKGIVTVHATVTARVDSERRLRIARSHTATHMLHWALRKVLGPEAVQAGAYTDAERLRFDFSSRQPLREEQRHEVETLVNQRVALADTVSTDQLPIAQAKQRGALAMFGEKYGDVVRVVSIGDYSKELCGGTHLPHTGFVGAFRITTESSIAAGTRRVEALVGDAAADYQQRHLGVLSEAGRRLGRPAHDVVAGLEDLLDQLKRGERDRKALQHELAKFEAERLTASGKRIGGVTFVAATVKHGDRETLAMLADAVKGALSQNGIVVLAAEDQGRVAVVVALTRDVAQRVHAGELLKAIAPLLQGSGGGRPEFAQGGGKNPAGIPEALKRAEELVREKLDTA